MWSVRTQRTYTVRNGLPSANAGKPLNYRKKYPRAVSSVGLERLVYTQEVTGSNPVPPIDKRGPVGPWVSHGIHFEADIDLSCQPPHWRPRGGTRAGPHTSPPLTQNL